MFLQWRKFFEDRVWCDDANCKPKGRRQGYSVILSQYARKSALWSHSWQALPLLWPSIRANLVSGNLNVDCPSKVPHTYNVLGYFYITSIWTELSNGQYSFKYRLEKANLTEKSWWAPKGSPDPPSPPNYQIKAQRKTCDACGKVSPEMFQQGWMCLNYECANIWQLDGSAPPADLAYNQAFLDERTEVLDQFSKPYNLKPEVLQEVDGSDGLFQYAWKECKGMVCPRCGRCNIRWLWSHWECQTPGCGVQHRLVSKIFTPGMTIDETEPQFTGHAIPYDRRDARLVTLSLILHPEFRIHTFEILKGCTITHFYSNLNINKQEGGPDEMFMALQQDTTLDLRRYAKSQSKGANCTPRGFRSC